MHTVLLLAMISSSVGSRNENVAAILTEVTRHVRAGCVYLLHEQDSGTQHAVLREASKKLMSVSVGTLSASMLSTPFYIHQCQHNRALYVIPLTPANSTALFHKVQLSSAIWLLFMDTNTSLDQFFTDINIPFDCHFLVAQPQGDHVVVLIEVYRVSPTLPLQTYSFGDWTAGGGLIWPSQQLYNRRNNLQGYIIRATHAASFLGQKYFDDIWTTLADSVNITTVFHEAKLLGSKSAYGSWNGIIALVSSGVADIGIGLIIVTKERSEVVTFSDTVGFGSTSVFIRLPNNSALTWKRYVAPFSYGLWLAVAIAPCALSVCLGLTTYSNDRNQGLILPAVFFYIQACFCQQGQPDEAKTTSGRIIILTTYVTSLVLLAAYSAFLISSLAVQPRDLPFKDLQGLLNDGSYRLGVLEDSPMFDVFHLATEGIESVVCKQLIAPFKQDMPTSNLEGFKRACNDHNYAHVGPNVFARYVSWLESCPLVSIPETSYKDTAAFIVPKNSPYKGLINWRLAHIRERGIQARILQQYVPPPKPTEQRTTIDVSMVTVAPILVLLAAGYVIGIVILLIERCVHGNIFTYWPRGSVRRHPENEC